jgi:translation elongation factor EF-Tu-like GTPase
MFRMPVTDVFSIRGRGTVAVGQVEEGIVRTGDEVVINGLAVRVDAIEAFRKIIEEARAGDNVGLLFSTLEKSQINRGDTVTAG